MLSRLALSKLSRILQDNVKNCIIKMPPFYHVRSISTEQHLHFEQDLPEVVHVLQRKLSGARMFILNRPEKLNALDLNMIRTIGPQLKAWDVSKLAKVIIMKSAGKGKFSVGDDILDILVKVKEKNPDALYFFQDKFRLVQMIATLQTPYVSILDGYALGGSLGLFVHGPFRIATEKTIFAVPEVSLGAFLNSGSSFYLSRLDGEIGTYLALTGARLEGIDTFFTGITTHYIPSSRLAALEDKLIDLETSEHEIIQKVLENFVDKQIKIERIGFQKEIRERIDRCFAFDSVEEIISALDKEKSTTWTRETKQKIVSMSPTSLKVTLKALRKARKMTFVECLEMEFDLIQKFLVTKDFHEGVESAFINKPRRKPQWQPSQISSISDYEIDQLYFTEASPNRLSLLSTLDFRSYPYARYGLPSEKEVRLAITGKGPEYAIEGRLKEKEEVLAWFMKGHKGKWGVRDKILDILDRKTISTKENGSGLVWKL
ncbi:ClpP/crotonase-like domain-containing protein [Cokeromyces recurvatus]|uniref:ClpP/crotonase-like domain-containing protein n=1 Tax=Cokeromyces recurvatus TaxID=90255 RepID=UPI002220A755|nr:ClpP/crotonase-like domain-containing protein [Cokeromyces recurvatus]KAI7900649.1 ClpP/crotonase-like domain-containing protein [Cokeromyces recurvatus]